MVLGNPAKAGVPRNPKNTVHSIALFIGRKYDDAVALADEIGKSTGQPFPFKIKADENGFAAFEVEYQGNSTLQYPVDLCSHFLAKAKAQAEQFWNHSVEYAVVGVPCGATEDYVQGLRLACKKAGLTVLDVLNHPTAIAIAHNCDAPASSSTTKPTPTTGDVENESDDENSAGVAPRTDKSTAAGFDVSGGAGQRDYKLVLDAGLYTTRLSIISTRNGLIQLVPLSDEAKSESISESASELTALTVPVGSVHFDERIFNHFCQVFKQRNRCDLRESTRSVLRLRGACEATKKQLSNANQASVQLDGLFEGMDLFAEISRARYEMLTEDLCREVSKQIPKLIKRCKVDPTQIGGLLLGSGASSISHLIKECVSALSSEAGRDYSPIEVSRLPHNEESVAIGCAMHANILAQYVRNPEKLEALTMGDVYTLSASLYLRAGHAGGALVPLFKAGTPIPCSFTTRFRVPWSAVSKDSPHQTNLNIIQVRQASGNQRGDIVQSVASLCLPSSTDDIPENTSPLVRLRFVIDADGHLIVFYAYEVSDTNQKETELTRISIAKGSVDEQDAQEEAQSTLIVSNFEELNSTLLLIARLQLLNSQWAKWTQTVGISPESASETVLAAYNEATHTFRTIDTFLASLSSEFTNPCSSSSDLEVEASAESAQSEWLSPSVVGKVPQRQAVQNLLERAQRVVAQLLEAIRAPATKTEAAPESDSKTDKTDAAVGQLDDLDSTAGAKETQVSEVKPAAADDDLPDPELDADALDFDDVDLDAIGGGDLD